MSILFIGNLTQDPEKACGLILDGTCDALQPGHYHLDNLLKVVLGNNCGHNIRYSGGLADSRKRSDKCLRDSLQGCRLLA